MSINLYDTIYALCLEKGITPYKMCKDLGFTASLMSDLKAGRRKGLTTKTADKIATYFSVSLNKLLGKECENSQANTVDDEELNTYLEELKSRKEMRMLFSLAKEASKEDVEKAVKIIEALSGK